MMLVAGPSTGVWVPSTAGPSTGVWAPPSARGAPRGTYDNGRPSLVGGPAVVE